MKKNLNTKLLSQLSDQFGNSFYLLDSEQFTRNYMELLTVFKRYYSKCNIAYSYKTNYIPKIVQRVNEFGGYAEIVSDMELEIALRAGISPTKIIWNGPIKNVKKVQDVLLWGGTVNIDSVYEIENIRAIAEDHSDREIRVGIRCNYNVGDGVLSRFGIDVDSKDFNEVLSVIASTPNLRLINLQAHFAKRNPEYWSARAEGMLKVYDRIAKEYGLKPKRLDIGGGIYGKMPLSLSSQLGIGSVTYDDYAKRAAKLFAEHFKDSVEAPELFLEPGTALVGDCMCFVSRIETIKSVRGKWFATVGGSQKNISMTGLNPPITIISGGGKQKEYENLDIVGFTCIEGDVLQREYKGKLAVGDYIVVENCGSYSLVMKPPFILPNFPVVEICEEKIEIIKQAETFDDLFHTFAF